LDSNSTLSNNDNEFDNSDSFDVNKFLEELNYGTEPIGFLKKNTPIKETALVENEIIIDFTPTSDTNNKNFSGSKNSGLKLFNNVNEEIPKLLEPIFPKKGLISLVGSSDTGKSTLLRQLSISIAFGLDEFLGYKLNTNTRNVIYVSTEDDAVSVGHTLKKQVIGLFKEKHVDILDNLNHIKFIFDSNTDLKNPSNILSQINDDLNLIGADLVIIDAFTDVFNGDLNSSTKVREFLHKFSLLADYHNCLFLILHHTGKRTEKFTASKDNVLGSQAFEAKMRALFELKRVSNNESKRSLVVTKGNYLSSSIKKEAKILTFDEDNLLFYFDGETVLNSQTSKSYKIVNPDKSKLIPIIEKLHSEKKSLRQIEKILKSQGFEISKSTVSNYLNEMKKS
jgi:RecA-family ATPase